MGTTPRYKVILAQLHLRKATIPALNGFADRIRSLMNATYQPQEKRNRIVHDAWYVDTNQNRMGQFRTWPHKNLEFGIREVDLGEIEEAISAAKVLTARADALFDEINAIMAGGSPLLSSLDNQP